MGEISVALLCHSCGYDLRAHPQDGQCPECGALVAESRRLATSPRWLAWRDRDPRWRRRILAGAWILVFLPMLDVLRTFEWASSVPALNVFDSHGTIKTLDDTLIGGFGVYQPLIFCIGVVLLFSKERGLRRTRLEWTRRWGVGCSYVVLLLSAAEMLYLVAFVMLGIAALLLSIPPKYQPEVTQRFIDVSTGYFRYGPQPSYLSAAVLLAFASIAILLACVRLFDALRSSGPKYFAAILLAPLAIFALAHLVQVGRYCFNYSSTSSDYFPGGMYFWPGMLVRHIADRPVGMWMSAPTLSTGAVEAAKWCIVFAIAMWVSIAQLAAWGKDRKPRAG